MKKRVIKPVKKISGEIGLPGDKSISHRAVMCGAISQGQVRAKYILDCDDCNFTIKAFRDMGISIERKGNLTVIKGKGLKGLGKPKGALNAGNSGTTMRLLAGILAGQGFETTIEGDESLSARPMKRIIEPLSLMGAEIRSRSGEYPPLTIRGSALKGIDYEMPISSAQVKSAILFAGLYANGTTTVEERVKSRDHTERMLACFGADVRREGRRVSVKGGCELKGKDLEIPGDISSASFFMAAAILLNGSRIRMNRVGVNPTRAGILDILVRMGADLKVLKREELFEPVADIEVRSGRTRGIVIEKDLIPGIIDELPVIFVIASLSKGRTVIKGAGELRVKETDRIRSMEENLRKMGARVDVAGDDIAIEGVDALTAADLKTFGDHRTCMAMTIAAMTAKDESAIDDAECVVKSFPGFFDTLAQIST